MARLLLVLAVISSLFWAIWRLYPESLLKIIVCDVGQGDAILLIYESKQILIDGGKTPELVLTCLSENMPIWDKSLEMVIASHLDADHIGGLPEVLRRYGVSVIIANTSSEKNTSIVDEFFSEIDKKVFFEDSVWRESDWLEVIKIDEDLFIQIVSPPEENSLKKQIALEEGETILSAQNAQKSKLNSLSKTSENDRSIVLFVKYKDFKILLTGDLECPGEIAMVNSGVTSVVDVLKVGHHGSKTSSCEVFLDAIRPEHSVISVGKNNSYNHPSLEVLSNLVAKNSKIWRTDEQGSIKIVSNGKNYWIYSQRN